MFVFSYNIELPYSVVHLPLRVACCRIKFAGSMTVAAALLNRSVWAIENDTVQLMHLRQRMVEVQSALEDKKVFVFQDDGSYPKRGFVGWEDSYVKLKAARMKGGVDHFYTLYGFRLADARHYYGIPIDEPEEVALEGLESGYLPSSVGPLAVPAGERDENGLLQTNVGTYFPPPSSLPSTYRSFSLPLFSTTATYLSSSSSSSSSSSLSLPFTAVASEKHNLQKPAASSTPSTLSSLSSAVTGMQKSGGKRKKVYVKQTTEEKEAKRVAAAELKQKAKVAKEVAKAAAEAEKQKGLLGAQTHGTAGVLSRISVRKTKVPPEPVEVVEAVKDADEIEEEWDRESQVGDGEEISDKEGEGDTDDSVGSQRSRSDPKERVDEDEEEEELGEASDDAEKNKDKGGGPAHSPSSTASVASFSPGSSMTTEQTGVRGGEEEASQADGSQGVIGSQTQLEEVDVSKKPNTDVLGVPSEDGGLKEHTPAKTRNQTLEEQAAAAEKANAGSS
jgi:hypothetical protein